MVGSELVPMPSVPFTRGQQRQFGRVLVTALPPPSVGTPVPTPIPPPPNHAWLPPTGALEIEQALPIHAGRYTCTARNSVGVARKHMVLTVQGKDPSWAHLRP